MRTLLIAGLVLATTIAGTGIASATTYAAPPTQDGYPNAGGSYVQSYVTANVNVRENASRSSAVVNQLRQGDFVNVGACRDGWCYVDVQGGSGWVSGRYIGRGENPYYSRGPAGPGIPLNRAGFAGGHFV